MCCLVVGELLSASVTIFLLALFCRYFFFSIFRLFFVINLFSFRVRLAWHSWCRFVHVECDVLCRLESSGLKFFVLKKTRYSNFSFCWLDCCWSIWVDSRVARRRCRHSIARSVQRRCSSNHFVICLLSWFIDSSIRLVDGCSLYVSWYNWSTCFGNWNICFSFKVIYLFIFVACSKSSRCWWSWSRCSSSF